MLRLAALAVLVICLGSHVSELFDTWDNTFQTGNDIESSFVIAALTLGAALGFMSATALLLDKLRPLAIESASVPVSDQFSEFISSTHSPPPIPLRI